eukprot:gene24618-biopygen13463
MNTCWPSDGETVPDPGESGGAAQSPRFLAAGHAPWATGPGGGGGAVSPALASRCSYGGPGVVQHLFGRSGSRYLQTGAGPRPALHMQDLL